MHSRRRELSLGLLLLTTVLSACATAPEAQPTLTFEEHTLRIPLSVEANGIVSFAESPPLIGRIDLSAILQAEGVRPAATTKHVVQLMVHYGRFYLVAEGFRNIWEITPQPGSDTASYRSIPILADPGIKPATGAKSQARTNTGAGTSKGPGPTTDPGVKIESSARPVVDPRLSHYGSSRFSCLRLDRANGPPLFITPKGEAANACP
jgi:hypothetical protein